MKDKYTAGGVVHVERGTLFTNAYKNLKICVSDGDAENLSGIGSARLAEKRQHGVTSDSNRKHFVLVTSNEKATS